MKEKLLYLLGWAMMLAMSIYFFQNLLARPNGFMGINGDGYKNYATIEYHVKNDATYHHFDGMNYPYGDHLVFADAQPILANGIKFFSNHFFDISPYTRLFIHGFLLLSFLSTFYLIILIFNELGIEKKYTSLAAGAITWLSPQLARWQEHYALGYTFVIPLLIYLLLIFQQKKSLKSSIAIGIVNIFIAQIHIYYLGISLLFLSLFHCFDFFFSPKNEGNSYFETLKQKTVNSFFSFLIQVIIPFIFVVLGLKIGAEVSDRPSVPSGFLTYRTYWQSFFSTTNSFWNSIFQWKTPPLFSEMENVTYLGIAVLIGFIFFVFTKIKTNEKLLFIDKNNLFFPFLAASTVLLLLALGLPFAIGDWEKYLIFTGGLQQFRGIGRFAWVFFYLINIFIFFKLSKKIPLVFIVLAWFDVVFIHQKPIEVLESDFFNKKIQITDFEQNIYFKKYQAIVPLPFFHVGSEQFNFNPEAFTLPYTFHFALEKKLPLVASQMSRTSFEQSYEAIRFALFENGEKPEFCNHLPSEKPLLVIQNKTAFPKDTIFQNWNGFSLKSLAENNILRFYELDLKSFLPKEKYLQDNSEVFTRWLSEDNIFFKKNIDGQKKNQIYKLKFDWLCEQQDQPLLEYEIRELHPTTGTQLHYYHYGCRYQVKNMYNNHFVSCEIPFETWFDDSIIEVNLFYKNAAKKVKLVVKNFKIE